MPEIAQPDQRKTSPASVSDVVLAWNSLGSVPTFEGAVEEIVLKRRAVAWRFNPFGPGGHSVIAKRCSRATAAVEHLIYSQILPQSGLDALQCFGMADSTTEGECWLFVEDAGGIAYSHSTPGHSDLAAQWLATMHTATAAHAEAAAKRGVLPRRGSAHYMQTLLSAQGRIETSLANPSLDSADREVLAQILHQCDELTRAADRLDVACAATTPTLVHGDWVEKNMRVCGSGGALSLKVFDWEVAGFGPPASDLAQCGDLRAYVAALPRSSLDQIERLALVGKVFRWSCAIDWQSHGLSHPWTARPMRSMRAYEQDMRLLLPEIKRI